MKPNLIVVSTKNSAPMEDMTQPRLRGLRACLALAAAAVLSVGCGSEAQGDSATQTAIGAGAEETATTVEALKGRAGEDSVYIGDVANNTVKRYGAKTGEFQGVFVKSGNGLDGPRGLLFGPDGDLVLVNQNVNQAFAGEVFEYNGQGDFSRVLVSHLDPNSNPNVHAPFAPRGIVRKGHRLYVADMGETDRFNPGAPKTENPLPPRVAQYDERTGACLGDLTYDGFALKCPGRATEGSCVQWSARAVVFGPDGALYVSVMKFVDDTNPNTLPGRVLRFPNSGHGTGEVFIDGETCNCGLARPEGLVFGPDGKLYVTSFRTSADDNDKILIFNGTTGAYEDKIDLDVVGQPRAFAQALLFGPGGKLYVPISGNGPDTGSVRRYDVGTKTFEVFVQAGGDLIAPFYLTFGKTHPATLEYRE